MDYDHGSTFHDETNIRYVYRIYHADGELIREAEIVTSSPADVFSHGTNLVKRTPGAAHFTVQPFPEKSEAQRAYEMLRTSLIVPNALRAKSAGPTWHELTIAERAAYISVFEAVKAGDV